MPLLTPATAPSPLPQWNTGTKVEEESAFEIGKFSCSCAEGSVKAYADKNLWPRKPCPLASSANRDRHPKNFAEMSQSIQNNTPAAYKSPVPSPPSVLETSQKWRATPHSGAYLLARPSCSPLPSATTTTNPLPSTPFLHITLTPDHLSPSQPTNMETHPDHHPPNQKEPRPVTRKHLARAQIPLWRNWLARLTVNQEVGSSSLPGGGRVCGQEREHMLFSSPLFLVVPVSCFVLSFHFQEAQARAARDRGRYEGVREEGLEPKQIR